MKARFDKILLAVALAAFPAIALAQSRVDNSGALDNNNAVGSYGRNDQIRPVSVQPSGNQVIYGNVTYQSFRGPVPYTDPRAFRGPTAGSGFDRFIRDSAGTPSGNSSNAIVPGQAIPFYGDSRAVPPPPGYTRQGFTGTYVPASVNTAQVAPASLTNSLGQGSIEYRTLSAPTPQSDMIMPGPIDPATRQPTMITGSPLYGIRQWKVGDPIDDYYLKNQGGAATDNLLKAAKISPEQFQQMRGELEDKSLDTPVGKPLESPDNDPLGGASRLNKPLDREAMAGGVDAELALRHRLLLPEQQSSQYAELRTRLERYYDERGKTDADFNRDYQLRLKAAKEDRNPLAPTLPGLDLNPRAPGVTPPTPRPPKETNPTPDTTPRPPVNPTPARPTPPTTGPTRPDPVNIGTLTKGIEAKGLADVLGKAEEFMKQGKFNSALDQYAAAARLAPNNGLVTLGKAHAQLGAMYYNRADITLRQAIAMDAALLMGRYDLTSFFGQKRLDEVVADLKALSSQNPESSQPVFLLAYVAYNTGDTGNATKWLAEADRRADGKDAMIRVLREHWKLPEANK